MEPVQFSITKPYIKKVLVISTGHITEEDAELLRSKNLGDEPWGPIVYPYEEGFFVYVGPNPQDFKPDLIQWEKHFSKAFCNIVLLAHTSGYTYVQFDADGVEYADLKTFDW